MQPQQNGLWEYWSHKDISLHGYYQQYTHHGQDSKAVKGCPKNAAGCAWEGYNNEAGIQLPDAVHLQRSPQVMQVSRDVQESCHQEGLNGCVHLMHIKNNKAWSNACWQCGGIVHFHKDCITILPSQDSDKDKSPSDTSPIIVHTSHTLTASMAITDLTFKVILKELVSSAISNRKAAFAK